MTRTLATSARLASRSLADSKKRAKFSGLAVAMALLIAGCAAPVSAADYEPVEELPAITWPMAEPDEDQAAEIDELEDEEEYKPEIDVAPYWPLTGVPADSIEEWADRPIIGVKIENTGPARPQFGLELADQVWEIVVEGGITRFIALYQTNYPTAVGPIRSVRTSDIGVMTPLTAVLAFSGGYGPAISRVQMYGIQTMSEGRAAGFRRTPDRRAPHNVLGNVETFAENANDDRRFSYPNGLGLWSEGIEDSSAYLTGEDVSRISVRVSPAQTTNWDWDAASGTFLRSDGSRPSVSNTGERHAATNVMVAVMDQGSFAGVPETQMLGSGPALIATGGRVIEGTWEKIATYRPLRFFDADGVEVQLAPGQTWYMLSTATSNNWTITP